MSNKIASLLLLMVVVSQVVGHVRLVFPEPRSDATGLKEVSLYFLYPYWYLYPYFYLYFDLYVLNQRDIKIIFNTAFSF